MLSHDTPERWLPVVGYEGWYEVSDLGRVRRVRRGPGTRPGLILKPKISRGYLRISLSKNDQRRSFTVHYLVAAVFIGPRPADMDIDHVNGVKPDNQACNLEYVTDAENRARAVRLGLSARGMRNGKVKLSNEQVREIRALAKKISIVACAARYGMCWQSIWNIQHRYSWKHLS